MEVKISLPQRFSATLLKAKLISMINENEIETWSHVKPSKDVDVIYHNPDQYTKDPKKNVIFRVAVNLLDNSISFYDDYWCGNPVPDDVQILHHVTRLNAMILKELYKPGFKITIS